MKKIENETIDINVVSGLKDQNTRGSLAETNTTERFCPRHSEILAGNETFSTTAVQRDMTACLSLALAS